MSADRISIWLSPRGSKTAAQANAHPIAPAFDLEPLDRPSGRFLARYASGFGHDMAGQPVKAERANQEPAFLQPEKYDVFVKGDPVNAWAIDYTSHNSATGLEVMLKRRPRQRSWRLWERTDKNGTIWELDDETGKKQLEDATMSSILMRLTGSGLAMIVSIVAVPDGSPHDHLLIVEL